MHEYNNFRHDSFKETSSLSLLHDRLVSYFNYID